MSERDLVHPESGQPPFRYGPWKWSDPCDGEHFRRCGYCGSIHPEDLVAEPVWSPEWADRKYGWPHKFYVGIPNRKPDTLFAIGSTNGDSPGYGSAGDGGLEWVAWDDLTPEQLVIVGRDGYTRPDYRPPTFIGFGKRPNHFGKFYTTHLADPKISDEVKQTIQRKSGMRISFTDDGRVSWHTWRTAS